MTAPTRHLLIAVSLFLNTAAVAQTQRWSEKAADDWYKKQPWLVGSNYIPATAVNQLEMWQADTFDPARINLELTWAEGMGMNTMRVFLHDLAWQQDPGGFERRIGRVLAMAEKHGIRPILVLFDSCWDPYPQPGRQPAPRPGVHNSKWVQSPGAKELMDPALHGRFLEYAQDVVRTFAADKRILAWDVWNEPDNMNTGSYGTSEPPGKLKAVMAVLPTAFEWARAGNPTQPLTSGLWQGDWSAPEKLTPIEKMQIELSDVISFHNYDSPEEFEKRVHWLQAYHRPILCTEYMARANKSTFQGILPVAKKYKVAAYNWGLVVGKTQTNLPWDSWQKPYTDREPAMWFHDILTFDGKPYRPEEVEFIKQMIGGKGKRR
jgi:hypothetical protein